MPTLLLALLFQTSAADAPQMVSVGMAAPDVVVVTLNEGSVALGKLVPYEPTPDDEIKEENAQRTSVRRNGREIGTIAGSDDRRMLRTPDVLSGQRLDRKQLATAATWSISGGPSGSTRRSGFGVLKNGWAPFGFGIGGCPRAGAHHVVLFPQIVPTNAPFPPHIQPNREEYVAAGVTGLALILGHHPTNRPFVTGLESLPGVDNSWQSVHQILHLDSRYTGHRAPVGITVYGVVRPIRDGNSWPINWPLNRDQAVHPQYELWPEYENLHQFPLWGAMMEYTVWQSVAPTIWFAAELHVRGR